MRSLLLFALCFLVAQFIYAQDFNRTKIPEWVKPIEIPKDSKLTNYDIASGYYSVLEDYQVNLTDYEVFTRTAVNVLSYSGITNASQLSITYDTSYQVLNIHHLLIWRNEQKIDRTDELSFEIMHNEFNLNQGIYSGNITAYELLEDIRKGDIIEFAYSLLYNNPIFENEKYLTLPLEADQHIDLLSYRLTYPAERDYTFQFSELDKVPFTDTTINNMRELEIALTDIKPLQLEDNIPSWVIPYNYFSISSIKTWRAVNLWAQRVFKLDEEPDLEKVFEEIFNGTESTDDKINKVINYVQDDIRYMGIESGIGSIKPFSPEQVINQRFGDCKDKSLLLVWLLKKIGVENAFPVLVNTSMLHELDKLLPSNQVFNHCIVKFIYEDSTYWVDPTIALQGGDYKIHFTPKYGKVLVIGEGIDSLQTMTGNSLLNFAEIEERIVIRSASEPATLQITSKSYGSSADVRRSVLEYYSLEDLTKYYLEDLKALYPVVEQAREIEVDDDIDSNELKITYNYKIDKFMNVSEQNYNSKGYAVFNYEPQILYGYFNELASTDREFSYALNDSEELRLSVIVEFPREILIDDSFKSYDQEAYIFEETFEQISSKSVKIDYRYKNKVNSINAEDYKSFCEERQKIVQDLVTVFFFPLY